MTAVREIKDDISDDVMFMVGKLRAFRKERGMSMRELAEKVGTSQQQIDRLEKGKRRLTVSWLQKISEALDCEMADFLPSQPAKRDVSMMGRAKIVGALGIDNVIQWVDASDVYSVMFSRPVNDFSRRWFGVAVREFNDLMFSEGTELIFAEVDNVIGLMREGWLKDTSVVLVEVKQGQESQYQMGYFSDLKEVGRVKALLVKSIRNEF